MTVGKQGISKSMQYLMAYHLSSVYSSYRFTRPEEAKMLLANNLLDARHSKIIYVSFDA